MKKLFITLGLLLSNLTFADEKVGTLSIDDITLRPTVVTQEGGGAQFGLGDSSFALRWKEGKNLSAFVGIGDIAERHLPVYYDALYIHELGFYQAYAQYEG